MRIFNVFSRQLGKIQEINQRYSKPRIVMSPGVRGSLLFLRIYLLLLVGLMVYKFVVLLYQR